MEFKLNDYHRNVADEELLKDILRVANYLGKSTITRTEYLNNGGKYHSSTIEKRYGGWLKALRKCGLSPNKSQTHSGYTYDTHITTQDLIDDLLGVSKKINKKSFSSGEYIQNGKYSIDTFLNRFKTWNNALASAGLIPISVPSGKRVSEYACLEEIERVWTTLGRQPTATDIKNGIGKYSLHTYERRFDSWRKALEFFVAYMNGEQEVEKPEENDIQLPIEIPQENANKPTHKTKRER